MSEELSLFGSAGDNPIMPSDNACESIANSSSDLISPDMGMVIGGETIKTQLIPEENKIDSPNYVIDMSSLDEVYEYQMDALDALLDKEGDTSIYVNTATGLVKIGMGNSLILDRVLAISVQKLFSGGCRLFRDYRIGEKAVEVSTKDIRTMRLSI